MTQDVYNSNLAHAKLSASGADRWFLCGGSVQAEEPYDDDSNVFAEEGTIAHELGDICLKNNQDAAEYIDCYIEVGRVGIYANDYPDKCVVAKTGKNPTWRILIDDIMADNVQLYLDYVRSFIERGSILMPERRVSFAHIVPDGFGTSDAIMLNPPKRHLDIFDLKYGRVPVYAEGNRQGRMYAIGAVWEFGFLYQFETITIHIIQPRGDVRYTDWTITVAELNSFADEAKYAATKALSGQADRVAGTKQCTYCKDKNNCAVRYKWAEDLVGCEFDDITDLNPNAITDEQRSNLVNAKPHLEKFLRDVYGEQERRVIGGMDVEGFKVVRARTNRKINATGEGYLIEHLGDDAYKPRDFIGIGLAERGVGKKKFNEDANKLGLVDKPEGRLMMANVEDKRPAVDIPTFDNEENPQKSEIVVDTVGVDVSDWTNSKDDLADL